MTGADIVAQARLYLGVRYKHQGITATGLDCVGLPARGGLDLGLLPASFKLPAYNHRPDPQLFAQLTDYTDSVPLDAARAGDIVLMHFGAEERPQHIALLTDNGLLQVHPSQSIRRVSEHSLDAVWRARIMAAFRFRGVTE